MIHPSRVCADNIIRPLIVVRAKAFTKSGKRVLSFARYRMMYRCACFYGIREFRFEKARSTIQLYLRVILTNTRVIVSTLNHLVKRTHVDNHLHGKFFFPCTHSFYSFVYVIKIYRGSVQKNHSDFPKLYDNDSRDSERKVFFIKFLCHSSKYFIAR